MARTVSEAPINKGTFPNFKESCNSSTNCWPGDSEQNLQLCEASHRHLSHVERAVARVDHHQNLLLTCLIFCWLCRPLLRGQVRSDVASCSCEFGLVLCNQVTFRLLCHPKSVAKTRFDLLTSISHCSAYIFKTKALGMFRLSNLSINNLRIIIWCYSNFWSATLGFSLLFLSFQTTLSTSATLSEIPRSV